MRLADFIVANVEPILAEWEVFARGIGVGEQLTPTALRDHGEQILRATARDMATRQTPLQRDMKSKGESHHGQNSDALDGASDMHAMDRLGLGFDLAEVMSEYRALRASVLRLWDESEPQPHASDKDDLTRFNESIDQSLSKAVSSYTKRVNQARDMFLAILSHDLRNPLNAIAMRAQVVRGIDLDPEEARESSRQIAQSVSVMERMIGDLLDYTRTRLGAGMPVTPAPMDLELLGRELYEEFSTSNPGRKISFQAHGDLQGFWDADRVRQAISNLLGNAIQHGAEDIPVTLSLRGEASDVFIVVHNGGEPIPQGELTRIFDPLIRGSSAEHPKRNRPGSIGMGLYIAREVVKSHGGRIDVASAKEGGTSFSIQMPRKSAPQVGQPILDADHIRTM
jgi:signal transduction histidine kinase